MNAGPKFISKFIDITMNFEDYKIKKVKTMLFCKNKTEV
jgi:hypothetical protein